MKKCIVAVCLGLAICASAQAQGWLGVTDAEGFTWARVKIVNQSTNDTAWIISECRTATSSSATEAETDAARNWDGNVPAGAERYVWIYGILAGDINIVSAGGTVDGYDEIGLPDAQGNGEWVITVAADGTASAVVEPASYSIPSHTGTMPETLIEE